MTLSTTDIDLSPFQEDWDYSSYDKSVADFCSLFKDRDNKRIPLIFATPERAFASIRKKFHLEKDTPITFPFLSLQQVGDAVVDLTRRKSPGIKIRRIGLKYDESGNPISAYNMPYPIPYNFQYSVELWCRLRRDGRVAARQWAESFTHGDYDYINVDHGEGMGKKLVIIFNDGIMDNSQLEAGTAERDLRWTFSLRVEGWLPRRIEEAKIVHTVNVDVENQ